MSDSFDIKKHSFVPQHIKLLEKEKEELLEKLNIRKSKLPMIHLTDPAIQHLEVVEGDVIKIIRESIPAKTSVFYRVVVHG